LGSACPVEHEEKAHTHTSPERRGIGDTHIDFIDVIATSQIVQNPRLMKIGKLCHIIHARRRCFRILWMILGCIDNNLQLRETAMKIKEERKMEESSRPFSDLKAAE